MKNRKWWLLGSFSILIMVLVVIAILEESVQIEKKSSSRYLPPVSVVNLQSQDNKGVIQVYAEVTPRWATTLKPQVSGEIIEVSDHAFAGAAVKKGDLLILIENSAYQADVHEAEHALSEAKLSLLQEKKKSAQAQRDWQRSGINKTSSALALNKPQLEVAKNAVNAAESKVSAARKNLTYTRIKAPFSGIITTRHVSIGHVVTEGEELLSIVHDAQQDIAVALSKQQWTGLAENWRMRPASIRNMAGVEIAQAQIKRGGGFLSPKTRQYTLFLEINGTSNSNVLPGDFVQVALPGRIARNSLAVPEGALTRSGFIWYLDDADRLRQFIAKVLFHDDDRIIIETPSTEMISKHYPSKWRIATTPLASFLAGNPVKPVVVEEE